MNTSPAKLGRYLKRTCIVLLAVTVLTVGLLQIAGLMLARMSAATRLERPVKTVRVNGHLIRWVEESVDHGEFDIVFVHGSPGGAGDWRCQFASPPPAHRLIAYVRPGFGESTPASKRPGVSQQAGALFHFLKAVSTNKIVLVGHSYGAPVALQTAIQHPETVRGVVLIGGCLDPNLEKVHFYQRLATWPIIEFLVPRNLRQCNREMLNLKSDLKELKSHFDKLTVPVVMIHGERDPLVPVQNVEWYREQLSRLGKGALLESKLYPEGNHFIPWENPEAVTDAISTLRRMMEEQTPIAQNKKEPDRLIRLQD